MSYITHYNSVAILHGKTGLIISDNTSLAMYICPTVYKKKTAKQSIAISIKMSLIYWIEWH